MIPLALAIGCQGAPRGEDFDGDGVRVPEDCDDRNALVYPGANDIPYDGVDQDCDGSDLLDRDGDGFERDEDCDETSADVYPGAPDEPYDGIDSDCGGGSDFDADGDGLDDPAYGGTDCDDSDASLTDEDLDGDGFSTCTGDCDDTDPLAFPGNVAECGNGIDDDCDGLGECGLFGVLLADDLDVQIVGIASEDRTGRAFATLDDLDGALGPDLAIGAYLANANQGRVHVFTTPLNNQVTADYATLEGNGSFGFSVAATPGGVLVGALQGINADFAGAVYRYDGPFAGTLTVADADLTLLGESPSDRAGWAVADVDLGGPFHAIGAVSQDSGGVEAGAVYLVPTSLVGLHTLGAYPRVTGALPYERAGQSLAATDDVSGDGVGDLWVGAPGSGFGTPTAGRVYLVSSTTASTVADAGVIRIGEVEGDEFGEAIAAGDVDGDGIEDLLVGAPANDTAALDAGAAYLFLGPHDGVVNAVDADLVVRGRESFGLGATVALIDLDGDGADDIVVGGPAANDGDGGVAVFTSSVLGEVDVFSADALIVGSFAEGLGVALGGGAFSGGPWEDLIVGGDTFALSGSQVGRVVIGYGGDGSF